MYWPTMGRISTFYKEIKQLGLSKGRLKNLGYQEWCNLLNNKPVLLARHFWYKVEVFFEQIILDDPLGKQTQNGMLHILNFKKG